MLQRNIKGQTFPVNPIRTSIISFINIPIVDIVLGLRVSDNIAARKFFDTLIHRCETTRYINEFILFQVKVSY